MKKLAMVDVKGTFHCHCGAKHNRGAVNGVDVYRCIKCGSMLKVIGVAALRDTKLSGSKFTSPNKRLPKINHR